MHEHVRLFDELIRSTRAKTVLYLTWSRLNAMDRQGELSDAYTSIGRELGAIVAPVGEAWQSVLRGNSPIALHDRDGSHPDAAGSYLAACVFFSVITHSSPIGLPADIPGANGLDPDVVRRLQETAWEAASAEIRGLPQIQTCPHIRNPAHKG